MNSEAAFSAGFGYKDMIGVSQHFTEGSKFLYIAVALPVAVIFND
jgi:hypothetical protein